MILSITDENPFTVNSFLQGKSYHPPVLIDAGDAVHKQFHITGIPQTFVFNREGKLTGVAIDQSTQKQFFELLAQAACSRSKGRRAKRHGSKLSGCGARAR